MNEQTRQIAPQALAALAERYWAFECHELPLSAVLAGQTLHPFGGFDAGTDPLAHEVRDFTSERGKVGFNFRVRQP